MGDNSKIQWCTNTFNIAIGCSPVAAGCKNCYAKQLAKRRWPDEVEWTPGGKRKTLSDSYWNQLQKWNKRAEKNGEIETVFVCSLADWLEDHPVVNKERARLLEIIPETPHLHYLLLTKRITNFRALTRDYIFPSNVSIGASVSYQDDWNTTWPFLKRFCADNGMTTFVSMEPMLGPIWLQGLEVYKPDQIIIGGESGATSRWFDPQWAVDLINQIRDTKIAIFVKQMGTQWARKQKVYGFKDIFGEHGYSTPYKLGDYKGENPDYWRVELRRFESIPGIGGKQ